jgi:hypothetical protein
VILIASLVIETSGASQPFVMIGLSKADIKDIYPAVTTATPRQVI